MNDSQPANQVFREKRIHFCSAHIPTDCSGGKSHCAHLLQPPAFLEESCPPLATHPMHGLIPWVPSRLDPNQMADSTLPMNAYKWPLLNWPSSSGQSCILGVGSDTALGLLKMPRPLLSIQCLPIDEKYHPLSEQKAPDRKLSKFKAKRKQVSLYLEDVLVKKLTHLL